jgi:hypothetical protein
VTRTLPQMSGTSCALSCSAKNLNSIPTTWSTLHMLGQGQDTLDASFLSALICFLLYKLSNKHSGSHWQTWENQKGVEITSILCSHLGAAHGDAWRKILVLERLKNWEQYNDDGSMCELQEQPTTSGKHDRFTLECFLELLLRFLVVNHQVWSCLVQCPRVADGKSS